MKARVTQDCSKKIWCCGKSHNCKAKFFVHTKPNHQSWHPKQVRAIFVKELWINFVWGCLIEVKWALKILDYAYCKILVSFLSLEETLVFLSFLSFLTFQNSREKRPFESQISSFFVWRTSAAVSTGNIKNLSSPSIVRSKNSFKDEIVENW